jgi:hypothetical protein
VLIDQQRQHGFRPRGGGPGVTQRLEHKFTKDESVKIIQFAKRHGLTVNELGELMLEVRMIRYDDTGFSSFGRVSFYASG